MVGSFAELGVTRVWAVTVALLMRWLRGRVYFSTPLTMRVNSSPIMRSHRSEPPSVSLPGRARRSSAEAIELPARKKDPSKFRGLSILTTLPSRMLGAEWLLGLSMSGGGSLGGSSRISNSSSRGRRHHSESVPAWGDLAKISRSAASTETTTMLGLWALTVMSIMSSCSLAKTLEILTSSMWVRGCDVANMKPIAPVMTSRSITVRTRQLAKRFRNEGLGRYARDDSKSRESRGRRLRVDLIDLLGLTLSKGVRSSSAPVVVSSIS